MRTVRTGEAKSRQLRHGAGSSSVAMVMVCLFVQLLLSPMAGGMAAASDGEIPRFFRMGDGKVRIRNAHNGREANVQLVKPDGSLDAEALKAIDGVFGFFPGETGEHVSLRLLFLLDYFSDKAGPGKVIHLQSGYRDPAYNEKLRKAGGNVAPTSAHLDGMALDFYVDGVNGKRLWEMIRKEECAGVGHYGGRTVHLDSGRPRFWEAASSKVTSGESEFNRRIYLSTEYDRYRSGEKIRVALSSVSDFGFAMKRKITFVKEGQPAENGTITALIEAWEECVPITDRKATGSLYVYLPQQMIAGRYRIHAEFCAILFPKMPVRIISNLMEVIPAHLP